LAAEYAIGILAEMLVAAVHHTSVTKGCDHFRDLPLDGVTMLLRSPLAIAALALVSAA